MASLSIPPDGLVLVDAPHVDKPTLSPEPPQVIRLSLAQSTTERILKTLHSDEQVRLRFGKRISIEYGRTVQHVQSRPEIHSTEVYRLARGDISQMYFSGKSSHVLEVQRAKQETAQADEALRNLQSTIKSCKEERAAQETSLIPRPNDTRNAAGIKKAENKQKASPLVPDTLRKGHRFDSITRSTPSSPLLSSSFSPNLGPTSAPLLSGVSSSKEKIRQNAIKIPLIHLLAARPMTANALVLCLHAPKEDCDKILEKYAKDCQDSNGKKELKDRAYRDLDVWKFPYASKEDREAAVERAIQAYDRMRIGKTDPLWQLLLPEERRGKGEYLSRLNFDRPGPSLHNSQISGEHGNSGAKEENSNEKDVQLDRGRLVSKSDLPADRTRSQNPVQKKRVSEKEVISKHVKQASFEEAKAARVKSTSTTKTDQKREKKFKSAERIENSDEEIKEAKAETARYRSPERERSTTTASTASTVKHDATKTSISPGPRKPPNASRPPQSSVANSGPAKARGNNLSSSLGQASSRPRDDSFGSGVSPRPRTGSSPQKPSPLASSSPMNANDIENSTSSKSSSSSTAATSPPSSVDMGKRTAPSSSNKASHKSSSSADSPLKRKAQPSQKEPPAKRQQTATATTKAPPTYINPTRDPPTLKPSLDRQPSTTSTASGTSASSSSPETSADAARAALFEKSQKFYTYYDKYKQMYDKVSSSGSRDKDEVSQLLRMHERIADLKKEIWDEYRRLGEPEAGSFAKFAA